MTRYGMTPRHRRLVTQFAATALAAVMLAGAATAQEAEPPAEDAEAAEETAEAAAPAAPSHMEACGAARCLTVDMSPELHAALSAGGATLEQLAQGLSVSYAGQEPLRAYFVAARYADDRLVRYDVSDALNIAPGQVTFPDAADVLQHTFGPRTETGVTITAIEATVSTPDPELPASGFVGSMPANTLMAMVRPDLTEPLDVAQRNALDDVAVIAVIPRDTALRENLESKSIGAVLRLNYTR